MASGCSSNSPARCGPVATAFGCFEPKIAGSIPGRMAKREVQKDPRVLYDVSTLVTEARAVPILDCDNTRSPSRRCQNASGSATSLTFWAHYVVCDVTRHAFHKHASRVMLIRTHYHTQRPCPYASRNTWHRPGCNTRRQTAGRALYAVA